MPVPLSTSVSGSKEILTSVAISTANTNRDGTGTLGTVVTAGSYGSVVTSVRITATVTTTAGVIRFYLVDASAAVKLIDEVLVTAITPSVSVAVFTSLWTPPASTSNAYSGQPATLLVPAGWTFKASTHNAENFNLVAKGYDL